MSSCGVLIVGLLRSMSNFLSKQRQLLRFAAVSSQIYILISRAFMLRWQTSLYISWGLP